FRGLFQLLEYHGGNLGGGVQLAVDIDNQLGVYSGFKIVGRINTKGFNIFRSAAHEPLGTEDGASWGNSSLSARYFSDADFIALKNGNNRRRLCAAFRVRDNLGRFTFENGNNRVCCAKVNPDYIVSSNQILCAHP